MKISIEISEASAGNFSPVKLCYSNLENREIKVEMSIDFLPLYDYSKDIKSIQFDFFLISTLVYGIDNLIKRESYSVDGWAREIEVVFPVNNVAIWEGNESILSETLKFLTGDYWQIGFEKLPVENLFIEKNKRWSRNIPIYEKQKIKKVSLFSGGLDSLIGVIDVLQALGTDERVVLASHFDSHSVGPNSDQVALEKILSKNYPEKVYWIQSTITLAREDTNGASLELEDSYRSRSFLFIGIGLYMFSRGVQSNELLIPENGTISLNYPLTPSRVSSLSTRTTHPYVFSSLQVLIDKIIGGVKLVNKYALQTKGEMVFNCLNQPVLQEAFSESVSCGKRGRKTYWAIKAGTDHCGVCMPCIYRRAALHKKGLDSQLYGNDILKTDSVNSYVDMPALFDYLKISISHEKIKRDLLVNGSLPLGELDVYADVVSRSRIELLKWFSDKGNKYVKNQLGLK